MTNCGCKPLISPRVFKGRSWKHNLRHRISSAHWAVDHNRYLLRICDFTSFTKVFGGIQEAVPFSRNRSFGENGARAENTRNSNVFCIFAEGRPDAPGVTGNHRKHLWGAQLICTHMDHVPTSMDIPQHKLAIPPA